MMYVEMWKCKLRLSSIHETAGQSGIRNQVLWYRRLYFNFA